MTLERLKSVRLRAIAMALAVLLTACQPGTGAQEAVADAEAAEAPFRAGRVHMGAQQLAVVPFVGHAPEMDLRVQCLQRRDAQKKAEGAVAPLCFDETPHPKLDRLRIEHLPGIRGSDAVRLLAVDGDAAHFIIERTGSIYQVLDVGLPARRSGKLRPGEVRIISGDKASHEALRDELVRLFPGMTVEVVRPAETPPAPRAPAPTPTVAPTAPAPAAP